MAIIRAAYVPNSIEPSSHSAKLLQPGCLLEEFDQLMDGWN